MRGLPQIITERDVYDVGQVVDMGRRGWMKIRLKRHLGNGSWGYWADPAPMADWFEKIKRRLRKWRR